jgi:hypothetical protein
MTRPVAKRKIDRSFHLSLLIHVKRVVRVIFCYILNLFDIIIHG